MMWIRLHICWQLQHVICLMNWIKVLSLWHPCNFGWYVFLFHYSINMFAFYLLGTWEVHRTIIFPRFSVMRFAGNSVIGDGNLQFYILGKSRIGNMQNASLGKAIFSDICTLCKDSVFCSPKWNCNF